MTRRKNEFREEDKIAKPLWCRRHRCLCGKQVGLDVEIAHLDPKKSDIDNAMPACFRCHAEIGRYNPTHPKGRSYKIDELKARRDQVYEEQTRPLVPVLRYMLHKNGRKLPMVGFTLIHTGNAPQVTAFVRLDTYVNGLVADRPDQYEDEVNSAGDLEREDNEAPGLATNISVPCPYPGGRGARRRTVSRKRSMSIGLEI